MQAVSRTNSAAVVGILLENYDGTSVLTPFIDTACSLVNRISTKDTAGELTSTDLELIERYLAAHYYTLADPLYVSKSTGGASGSFRDRSYYEAAKALDSTGLLAALELPTRPRAGCTWLGKPKSLQINYEDRD